MSTAPFTGKEAHSKGSYGSAFGFSARPPVHLWGTWDSSASTTSLISTCQAASCCGWIQGMSGAMSRSHLNWQDQNEGPGAGIWCWLAVKFTGVLHPQNIIRPTPSILPTEHHLTHIDSLTIPLRPLEKKLYYITYFLFFFLLLLQIKTLKLCH